jgi:ankyrin repeat protein
MEIVKYLVENNADVNAKDRWNCTPLHDTTDPEIESYLLQNGAIQSFGRGLSIIQGELPINYKVLNDNDFRFIYAASSGDLQMVQRLNIKDCKINAFDYDDRTALLVAISEGHTHIVKYLCAHGADIKHKDFKGNDAYREALRCKNDEIVDYLSTII